MRYYFKSKNIKRSIPIGFIELTNEQIKMIIRASMKDENYEKSKVIFNELSNVLLKYYNIDTKMWMKKLRRNELINYQKKYEHIQRTTLK